MPGNRVFRREKPVQKQGDLSGMPVSVGYYKGQNENSKSVEIGKAVKMQ